MTISNENFTQSYNGDGTTVVFPIPYPFLDNSHIQVSLINNSAPLPPPTPLTEITHYTITGAGGVSGELTMVTAPAVGETLAVTRFLPITQLIDYLSGDAFTADLHEGALDKITMILQQLNGLLGRCSQLAIWDNSAPPDILTIMPVTTVFPAKILDAVDLNNTYAWEQVEPIDSSTSWQTLTGGLSSSTEGRAASFNACTSIAVDTIVEMMGITTDTGSVDYRFKNPGVCL